MFGPGVHSLQGQRMVICRARGDAWAEWVVQTVLSARPRRDGGYANAARPRDVGRAGADALPDAGAGLTLARLGHSADETMRFTSPAYLLELYVAARHFAQDPRLYGPIEMSNPGTGAVTGAFRDAAQESGAVIASGDQDAFSALFEDVQHFFGAFTEEALEQSSFLIDRIVERA
jgi:chorismate mutase/prephenate dehydrogenase